MRNAIIHQTSFTLQDTYAHPYVEKIEDIKFPNGMRQSNCGANRGRFTAANSSSKCLPVAFPNILTYRIERLNRLMTMSNLGGARLRV